MGTTTRFITVDDCSTDSALRTRWKALCQEDKYQRGHDIYQGSFADCDLEVSRTRVANKQAADAKAFELQVDKRQAVAIPYGDPSKAFPQSAADKKAVADLAAVDKALEVFEFEVLKRFVQGKSMSKRCGHCDSVISKKSRQQFARVPPDKNQSVLDYRDSIRELTACPACGHELLLTDTDKKRRESLKARQSVLATRVSDARKAFAKKTPPCGYIVVAGCPS